MVIVGDVFRKKLQYMKFGDGRLVMSSKHLFDTDIQQVEIAMYSIFMFANRWHKSSTQSISVS